MVARARARPPGRPNCRRAARSRSAPWVRAPRIPLPGQQLDRREADGGAEQIDQARDEETDAGSRGGSGAHETVSGSSLPGPARRRHLPVVGRPPRGQPLLLPPPPVRQCPVTAARQVRSASRTSRLPPRNSARNRQDRRPSDVAHHAPEPDRGVISRRDPIVKDLESLLGSEIVISDEDAAAPSRPTRSPPIRACRSPSRWPRSIEEVAKVLAVLPRERAQGRGARRRHRRCAAARCPPRTPSSSACRR